MFESRLFSIYQAEKIPFNSQLKIVNEKYARIFEQEWLKVPGGDGDPISKYTSTLASSKGFVGSVLVVDLFIDYHERYHYAKDSISIDDIVCCVSIPEYDKYIHVFVRDSWEREYLRSHFCIYAFFDAIDVKKILRSTGRIPRSALLKVQERLDEIADRNRDVVFISVADSIIAKTIWTPEIGFKQYRPERFICLFSEVRAVFVEVLDCEIYAIFTQGRNNFESDGLLHRSRRGNHIGLNSLGAPYNEIFQIDSQVKKNIKSKSHAPKDVYLEHSFFYSLTHSHKEMMALRERQGHSYISSLYPDDNQNQYFAFDFDEISKGLQQAYPWPMKEILFHNWRKIRRRMESFGVIKSR